MKIILDTNVFFSAFFYDNKILELVDQVYREHQVFVSDEILLELENKLFSPKAKKLKPNYNLEETEAFLGKIKQESFLIKPSMVVEICRDPLDNMFLEIAQTIEAAYIITGDKDLLSLLNHKNTQIIKPNQFYEEIGI